LGGNAPPVGNTPPECTTPTDCPPAPSSQLCAQATCVAGKCGIGPKAAGSVCRPAAGVCDITEVCDGDSLDCPADVFATPGTVCRPTSGPCDMAEVCNGFSSACPNDAFKPDESSCGTDQICCNRICCDPGSLCQGSGCCRTDGACIGRTPCCFGCEPSNPEDPSSFRVCTPS
jgi:hypothetical protein